MATVVLNAYAANADMSKGSLGSHGADEIGRLKNSEKNGRYFETQKDESQTF